MIRYLAVLCLIATPVVSQEYDPDKALDYLRACYDSTDTYGGKTACIGTVATRCQEETDGGYSTLGMATCNNDESTAWDVLLNEEYKETMPAFEGLDTEEAEYFPNLDTRVDTLRAAQRAWITYRDAECLNEYALWGAGSMRHISYTNCQMEETAERTIEIWAKREAY